MTAPEIPARWISAGSTAGTSSPVWRCRTSPYSAPTMVYGAKQGQSTAAVGTAMSGYAAHPDYAWLGTGTGGFSKTLTFPGATNPVGWVTRNQYSVSGFAAGIGSFTKALDQVIATADGLAGMAGIDFRHGSELDHGGLSCRPAPRP